MLTVAGRDLPISSGSVRYPTATGRMMVVTKDSVRTLSLFAGKDLQKVAWVIGLRAADGTTNFVGTLTSDEKAPGTTTSRPDGSACAARTRYGCTSSWSRAR